MAPVRTTAPVEGKTVSDDSTCFECDAPTRTEPRDHAFVYGVGASAVELNVNLPVRVCTSCGFEFLDHEAERLEHEAVCTHLGVLSPTEIRDIRRKYGMSRSEFSRVTGLGEATLNRWENAILIQNKANDRYLRLLALPENVRRLERLESSKYERGLSPASPGPRKVPAAAVAQAGRLG